MADLKLSVNDNSATADAMASAAPVERKPYLVTAESGVFKRGKQYDKGEIVQLDEKTAENFKREGDVEDLPEDQAKTLDAEAESETASETPKPGEVVEPQEDRQNA